MTLDQVITGDCREVLARLPAESVDLIFADPPYNLQLRQELWRPNLTRVDAVDDDWDRFDGFEAYDRFTREWLQACHRVLKPTGALWVIGSYHNIFRVGAVLQDLGFWILNDIVWVKSNPMPNFRGVRFTNAHETLIWAQKQRGARYTFHYQAAKALNDGLQMRSDWYLPICTGGERLRENGEKVHSTQKPEALLYRLISTTSNPDDVILDPFFGTGTTGVVARRLHRHWIGIEQDAHYAALAQQRIAAVPQNDFQAEFFETPDPRLRRRIPFGLLVEHGKLKPGQELYFDKSGEHRAYVLADGAVEYNGKRSSIHQAARQIRKGPANGWDLWYYQDSETGERHSIDLLRQELRKGLFDPPETSS